MKYFELNEQVFVPANKICNVFIGPDDNKKLVLWLDGGQTQIFTSNSEEQAKENYKTVTQLIKEL